MTTFALNGLGRIGKLALRPLLERGAHIAWLNDAGGDALMLAHLLDFVTVHGLWDADFQVEDGAITINGTRIPMFIESDPANLPMDGVDIVIDCTGAF